MEKPKESNLSKLSNKFSVKSSHIRASAPAGELKKIDPPSTLRLEKSMVHEDEFSYTNLRSMWSQRDKQTRPLKIQPPTARTPMRLSAHSPERRPIADASRSCNSNSERPIVCPARSTKESNIGMSNDANCKSTDQSIHEHQNWSEDLRNFDGSYEADITKNLMKTNANDLTNPSLESGSFELPSGEGRIKPKNLWQDSDTSWSTDSDSNFSYNSKEMPVDDENMGDVTISGRYYNKEISAFPEEPFDTKHKSITTSRGSFDKFDPYDNFESMSTVNSDVTVKAENKHATALMNALQKKKEFNISTAFDEQYEGDSNIPDSAFQSMAARLTSNLTGSSARNREAIFQKTSTLQDNPIDENKSMKAEEKTEENHLHLHSTFDSFYQYVPRGPQHGVAPAESDVFDGLSDVGSSIPAFGRNIFPPEVDFEETPTKQSNLGTADSKPSLNWAGRRDWLPEQQMKPQTQYYQNGSTFVKSSEKINGNGIDSRAYFMSSPLDTVGEEIGSEISDENTLSPRRVSVGIARVNEKSVDKVQDLSTHFELLTTTSNTVSNVLQFETVIGTNDGSSFSGSASNSSDNSDEYEEEESLSSCDVKYPENVGKAADIVASVTWMPSMLRLYKRRATGDKHDPIQASPNSVMGLSRENSVHSSDCRMNGFGTILLRHNRVYGGDIKKPATLVSKIKTKIDEDTKQKLRLSIDAHSGAKRIRPRRKKTTIFDRAVEVHERALSLFEMKKLGDSLEMYETFFECYSRREFVVGDKHEEKEIISNFLFNMGIIYAKMKECALASEFFNEALSTLEQINDTVASGNDIDVSDCALNC